MGKLKSYVRQKMIDIIKFAIREELNDQIKNLASPLVTMNMTLNSGEINKQIESWTWDRFKRMDKQMEHWTWDRFNRTDKRIESWTWDRYRRTEEKINNLNQSINLIQQDLLENIFNQNKVEYHTNEKIRVVMLFQIPSCWAAVDSVWEELKRNENFETTLLLYDREKKEPAQMEGSREFLLKNGISYVEAEYYNFAEKRPHILIYQTPYDDAHRPDFLKADAIKRLGIRIVYLPYGIAYSASVKSDFIFSITNFRAKPWLSFEISEKMIMEHKYLSSYGADFLLPTGLPKFDSLYYKEAFPLENYVLEKTMGRRIIFWQMHFWELLGNDNYPEPHISEYIKFAKKISEYNNLFFVVRPHPKYFEKYIEKGFCEEVEELQKIFSTTENLYIYNEFDYRPALYNSNYIIGDRSALMVEAIALDVPVLYMTNFYYKEKMLSAIEPIFDSYYQGSECFDMERFIDLVIYRDKDYKAEERRKAREICVPFFDGLCGKRIVESMEKRMKLEAKE